MNWTIEPLPRDGPLFEGAIAVYGKAFAEPPYNDPDRGREVRSRMREVHGVREDYRAFVALGPSRKAVGMIYGYHGAPGQWWHDTVRSQLTAKDAAAWLADSYEVVEVAVEPGHQSLGIGRALITHLLDGRPEATSVLSTRVDSRAHELYQRLGFEVITEMLFTVNGAPFFIMGKRLR